MKKVLVESPYKGDVERNTEYARACMADCFQRGEAPYASHLLYTQPGVLDDTKQEERALGIEAGLIWGKEASISAVYTDLGLTEGMKLGSQRAGEEGRPVVYRSLGPPWSKFT